MTRLTLTLLAACTATPAPIAPASDPIAPALARRYFDEAQAACTKDGGQLWGVSLCGPLMFADRTTRFVVANAPDAEGKLHARDGVYVGTLPADQNIANTAFRWAGVRWTQVAWPLATEADARGDTLLHEMFHRVQPDLGLGATDTANPHLATMEGRISLQLEWRALARALAAPDDASRRAAAEDALAFRASRHHAESEDALDLQEGLPSYTGVRLGAPDPTARALADMAAHLADRSFERSFAYVTGPAYGLLLDRYAPGWRSEIRTVRSLTALLARALGVSPDGGDVEQRASRYDAAALYASERERAARHDAEMAGYRAALVDGPIVELPFRAMKIQFDPNEVMSLDDLGNVYPHLRVSDAWGVLEVSGGALVRKDWSGVVVSGPIAAGSPGTPIRGHGWTLALAPGFSLAPGARAGDLVLAAQ
jgi:hypothetical protein